MEAGQNLQFSGSSHKRRTPLFYAESIESGTCLRWLQRRCDAYVGPADLRHVRALEKSNQLSLNVLNFVSLDGSR